MRMWIPWQQFRKKSSWKKRLIYQLGRIRLFQQIGLFFILGIVVPLLVTQAWVFYIQEKALKKEFRDLTVQMAVSIFRDFSTILRNQQQGLSTALPTLHKEALSQWQVFNVPTPSPPEDFKRLPPTSQYKAHVYYHLTNGAPFSGTGIFSEAAMTMDGNPQYRAPSLPHAHVPEPPPKLLILTPDSTQAQLQFPPHSLTRRSLITSCKPSKGQPPTRRWWLLPSNNLYRKAPVTEIKPGPPPPVTQAPSKPKAKKPLLVPPYLLVVSAPVPQPQGPPLCVVTWQPFQFFEPSGVLGTVFRSGVIVLDEHGVLMADGTSHHWEGYQLSAKDQQALWDLQPGKPELVSPTLVYQPQNYGLPLPWFGSNNTPTQQTITEGVLFRLANSPSWALFVISPFDISERYWERAQKQSLAIFLTQLAVVALLVFVFLYTLIQNFQQLIRGIQGISRGNYRRRVHLIVHPMTPFEIRYLSREFNRMGHRLAISWQQTEDTLRQLRQMDRFRSDLIDMVSHELRTPLTILKGKLGTLQRLVGTTPEARPLTLTMRRQVNRLERLIGDLLTVPDIERGSLALSPDWIPLAELITTSAHDVADRHGIDPAALFVLHLPVDDPDCFAWADPERMEQVLVNLMDNAVKYRDPDHPVTVILTPTRDAEGVEGWQVEVRNHTRMLKVELTPFLGEKFQRAVIEEQKNHRTGSGLGLYICHGLAARMGGTLTITATPVEEQVNGDHPTDATTDQGSWFIATLTLPKGSEDGL